MFSFFFFIHLSFFICVYVFARARVCVLYVVPDIDIRRNIVVCCSIISAHPTLCFSCSCSLSSLYLFHVNLKNTSLSTFIIKYDNLCLHQSQAVFFYYLLIRVEDLIGLYGLSRWEKMFGKYYVFFFLGISYLSYFLSIQSLVLSPFVSRILRKSGRLGTAHV